MQNEVITLIKEQYSSSTIGDISTDEISRNVFAEVKTIGLKRKMEAMESGLKLEYKFILTDELEYQQEPILEYKGNRYNIVNVYINDMHGCELITTRY